MSNEHAVPVPSYEQILALAPDESSARSARDLANVARWSNLGFDEFMTWGEVKGSGATPYRTCISVLDNAFKCSCPSRKFPCKHGLGLYLLLSKEPHRFSGKQPPDWAAEWASAHAAKLAKKSDKQTAKSAAPDPVAQAKRTSDRNAKVSAGLEDLNRWMEDLIRRGIATVHDEGYSYWDNQAKRMVDAQAPGVARMLRQCAGTASGAHGWQGRMLEELAQIKLLTEAYERIEELPEPVQADIRQMIGFNVSQEDVLSQTPVRDKWVVVAQRVEEDERLRSQRVWMKGTNTGRYALVLSFAHGTAPLDTTFMAGYTVDADIVFYPGSYPTRALLKTKYSDHP
ncbi:MAG TPA: SWIM zinc finger family protein, partial [Chroococcales cyanobacterium]